MFYRAAAWNFSYLPWLYLSPQSQNSLKSNLHSRIPMNSTILLSHIVVNRLWQSLRVKIPSVVASNHLKKIFLLQYIANVTYQLSRTPTWFPPPPPPSGIAPALSISYFPHVFDSCFLWTFHLPNFFPTFILYLFPPLPFNLTSKIDPFLTISMYTSLSSYPFPPLFPPLFPFSPYPFFALSYTFPFTSLLLFFPPYFSPTFSSHSVLASFLS